MQMALLDSEPCGLTTALRNGGRMRRTDDQGRRIPRSAARILAEGEFNRYYCRGVCRRALTEGLRQVEVVRARASFTPRESSLEVEGLMLDASWLLDDLRRPPGEAVGAVPGGPGSGITVRIPRHPRIGGGHGRGSRMDRAA